MKCEEISNGEFEHGVFERGYAHSISEIVNALSLNCRAHSLLLWDCRGLSIVATILLVEHRNLKFLKSLEIAGMWFWRLVKITSVQNADAPSRLRQISLGKSLTGFDIDESELNFACYGSVHERTATLQRKFLITKDQRSWWSFEVWCFECVM